MPVERSPHLPQQVLAVQCVFDALGTTLQAASSMSDQQAEVVLPVIVRLSVRLFISILTQRTFT